LGCQAISIQGGIKERVSWEMVGFPLAHYHFYDTANALGQPAFLIGNYEIVAGVFFVLTKFFS
jgi:hypothetical protein